MSLPKDITDFLMSLPGMESTDGRRSLLLYVGFGQLAPLIQFEGNIFDFASRLVALLAKRGKGELRAFLVALDSAPQVSFEKRNDLATLVTRLDALDEPTFAAEFGLGAAASENTKAITLTRLIGKQYGALQQALIAAFMGESLTQMVKLELDENLAAIAGGSNLGAKVFALIDWAERTGRLSQLIQGAMAANPDSPELSAFVASLGA